MELVSNSGTRLRATGILRGDELREAERNDASALPHHSKAQKSWQDLESVSREKLAWVIFYRLAHIFKPSHEPCCTQTLDPSDIPQKMSDLSQSKVANIPITKREEDRVC